MHGLLNHRLSVSVEKGHPVDPLSSGTHEKNSTQTRFGTKTGSKRRR